MTLTIKQKETYLMRPAQCPACHSDNITSDGLDAEGVYASAKVACNNCGATWQDIYRIVQIEDFQPGPNES